MNILIIEDEIDLQKSIVTYLKKEGYHCEVAANLEEALEKIWLYKYDCIIVDITLPDGSGLAVVEKLKSKKSKVGIIIVSARGELEDRIKGLEIGADDYLSKPFDLSELNARIKALLRRRNFDAQNEIVVGDLVVDPANRGASIKGKPVNLTRKEFDLLLYFISNPNRVVTKESIAEHLWGDDMDLVDSYDFIYSQLKNLRKKIFEGGGTDSIETIYGIGYKFIRG